MEWTTRIELENLKDIHLTEAGVIPFLKYNVPFLTEILSEGIPIPDKSR